MPIFEFECHQCGLEFEKLVRKAEAVAEVACPACGSKKVEEKISAFASVGNSASASPSGSCAPGGG